MQKNPGRASSKRTAAAKHLDMLIEVLNQARSKAQNCSSPSLADLKRALNRARKLRRQITDEHRRVNWKLVLVTTVVLAKLAEKILSILFCDQPRGVLMRTGSIIRTLRTVRKISQTDLAHRLEVTRAYLSQIENERRTPSLSFLKDTADKLEVPLVLLVSGEDERASGTEIYQELRKLLTDLMAAYLNIESSADGGLDSMNARTGTAQHPRGEAPLPPSTLR